MFAAYGSDEIINCIKLKQLKHSQNHTKKYLSYILQAYSKTHGDTYGDAYSHISDISAEHIN